MTIQCYDPLGDPQSDSQANSLVMVALLDSIRPGIERIVFSGRPHRDGETGEISVEYETDRVRAAKIEAAEPFWPDVVDQLRFLVEASSDDAETSSAGRILLRLSKNRVARFRVASDLGSDCIDQIVLVCEGTLETPVDERSATDSRRIERLAQRMSELNPGEIVATGASIVVALGEDDAIRRRLSPDDLREQMESQNPGASVAFQKRREPKDWAEPGGFTHEPWPGFVALPLPHPTPRNLTPDYVIGVTRLRSPRADRAPPARTQKC